MCVCGYMCMYMLCSVRAIMLWPWLYVYVHAVQHVYHSAFTVCNVCGNFKVLKFAGTCVCMWLYVYVHAHTLEKHLCVYVVICV